MATIFAADESKVLVDGDVLDGIRSIEYRHVQVRENVYSLGSSERLGLISGPQYVEARIHVVSTSPVLNGKTGSSTPFQVTAELKQGETRMTVSFDECFLMEKTFDMKVGGSGEAVYTFTATRAREEESASE